MAMFTKEQRGTFRYTAAHVLAYNMEALKLGVWKPKFIFHDWEKPWMLLLAKLFRAKDPYKYVQEWHRHHRKHHVEYFKEATLHSKRRDCNVLEMVIDWECSRHTKETSPRTAYQQYLHKKDELPSVLRWDIERTLKDLGLWES